MKKIIISLVCILSISTLFSKTYSFELYNPIIDRQVYKNDSLQRSEYLTYKLFPTQNVWTFIKLNTKNGKIWQVQYDIEGDNRHETYINMTPLAYGENKLNGRFTLYPTQNIFTFILLDQIDGRMWQVQWSMESETRFIVPFE